MPLIIHHREADGVTVLDLAGRLVWGEEASALRRRVKQLVGEQKKNFLLNLADVEFIDSSGAGTIVACFTSARAAGGDLKLVGSDPTFRKVLELTRLLSLLELHESEDEALASFRS